MKIIIMSMLILTSSIGFAKWSDTSTRYEVEAQLEKIESNKRGPGSIESKKIDYFQHIDKKERFKIKYKEKVEK